MNNMIIKSELYDNKMCEDFLLNNYSEEHKNIFNYIKHGPIKADFWRICIINKFGGLYVDSDIMPLKPLIPHWFISVTQIIQQAI